MTGDVLQDTMRPARLNPGDVLRVGAAGLLGRPTRVVLSALGIAIGIATMIAVVGISSSSQAELLRQLDRLGTNLLTVKPGQSVFGDNTKLPIESVSMVRGIAPVHAVSATGAISATVRRTDKIPADQTGGISVRATSLDLLSTLQGKVVSGSWLNAATERYPSMVLGAVSAQRLGVTQAGTQVWVDHRWFTVVGILGSLDLAPEIDRSALVGWPAAQKLFGFDGHPTMIYERSSDAAVADVAAVLARTVNPENPEEVEVSRPSDALAARTAAAGAFTNLLLGLGAVALLVGGVGIANTMIISVLERRREIGRRRAIGATRGQIRLQFLTESLLLSGLGGAVGAVLGAAVTLVYAATNHFPAVVPPWAFAGGLGATLVIGVIAGIYPAVRASRLSPTVALAAT
ncbi:ABC transporter permease [Nonomuraea sp. NPDC049695]|uniref:ABC transporter permease n=1 Tax=Nonomuraea sp. NPDC049695 TaxID=3154734 RepID=UPI00342C61A4